MDLYEALLFAHIIGAVVLVGGSIATVPLLGAVGRATTVASLRDRAKAVQIVLKAQPPAAVVVLLAGIGMTIMSWSFADAWIAVALVIFLSVGALAGAVMDPYAKRVVEAADAAPDGPVPAEVADVVHDRRAHVAHAFFVPLDVAVIALMTAKPGLAGALGVAAAGLVVGGAVALREQRGVAAAPAA